MSVNLKETMTLICKAARELLSANNKYYFKSSPFVLENVFHIGDSITTLCISSTCHNNEFKLETYTHRSIDTDFISLSDEWALKLLNFLNNELELKGNDSILPCYNERMEYYYHIDIRNVYWEINGVNKSEYRNDLMTPNKSQCYEQLKQQHRNVLDALEKEYFSKIYKHYCVEVVYNDKECCIDTFVNNELIIHCEIIPLKMFFKLK